MKTFIFILIGLTLFSCGSEQSEKESFAVDSALFSPYINEMPMPEQPNPATDKLIVNESYPIKIALYEDNTFYYDLPNLGDGKGTYSIVDGKIALSAERTLFVMYIEMKASDELAENVHIVFRDRFGLQTLDMKNENFQSLTDSF